MDTPTWRLKTEARSPAQLAEHLSARETPNPKRTRRIDAAAIHLVIAIRHRDTDKTLTALSAILDEGLTVADVLVICASDVNIEVLGCPLPGAT